MMGGGGMSSLLHNLPFQWQRLTVVVTPLP